jgi:hypothetical protein
VGFNFIIVASSLKFSISTMCHYKIMKQKVSSSYTCMYIFLLCSRYIKVYIYFLVKFCTLGFILKSTPPSCISVLNTWLQRHVWLVQIQYIQSWPESSVKRWNTIIEADWQTTSSLNTHSHVWLL